MQCKTCWRLNVACLEHCTNQLQAELNCARLCALHYSAAEVLHVRHWKRCESALQPLKTNVLAIDVACPKHCTKHKLETQLDSIATAETLQPCLRVNAGAYAPGEVLRPHPGLREAQVRI